MAKSTAPVLETRSYVKRKGSAKNPFTPEEKQAIRDSVREVGILQTVNDFKTLYIYVKAVCDEKRIKIALGRRPDSDKVVKTAKVAKVKTVKEPKAAKANKVVKTEPIVNSEVVSEVTDSTVNDSTVNKLIDMEPVTILSDATIDSLDVEQLPSFDDIHASIDEIIARESGELLDNIDEFPSYSDVEELAFIR